jgi:hypothetical protein
VKRKGEVFPEGHLLLVIASFVGRYASRILAEELFKDDRSEDGRITPSSMTGGNAMRLEFA